MVFSSKCFAYLVHTATKIDMFFLPVLLQILQFGGLFLVSSKRAKSLNETFDFLEIEGDSLLRHVPIRWL